MRTMECAMGTCSEDDPCRDSDAPYAPYAFENEVSNAEWGKVIWRAHASDSWSTFQTISGKSEGK